MILTGKAKKDFFNYVYELGLQELLIYDVSYNAMVIEWFDSVGIYINVSPRYIGHDLKYSLGDFYAVINFKDSTPTCSGFNYNNIDDSIYSRNEATKQAIIKANEIYNNR